MYAKIGAKNKVLQYPYTPADMAKDFPNSSLPKWTPEFMERWSIVEVVITEPPTVSYNQKVVESLPTYNNGQYLQTWAIIDLTTDEVTAATESEAVSVRAKRDKLLADSDWTQVADAPVDKTAWATYRSALRDITEQRGFPWEVIWPQKP